MKKWADVKQQIVSVSGTEKKYLNSLAEIVIKLINKREELGWTQQELADRAGLKQSAIARIENTSSIPRVNTLLKIAGAMGMKLVLVEVE